MTQLRVPTPRPGEPVVLPADAPPVLGDLLGYRGGDRYVAIYFEQGVLRLDDGGVRDEGNATGWRQYAATPIAGMLLGGVQLGNDREDATHWLLLDRQTDRLTVGHAADIAALVAAQPHSRDRFNPVLAPGADVVRRIDPELRAANEPSDGPFWRSTLQREAALYAALDWHVERQYAAVVRGGIASLRADVADRAAGVGTPGTTTESAPLFDGVGWRAASTSSLGEVASPVVDSTSAGVELG
ncbi:hypothetical protein GCM10009827_115300 [Dactylosporangium maewongense]|uniref:Uncharacterized protein n=1 Tax=Dactylosporangium maewongense TaxID=634393 RepID=A0ABP4P620_9ACTN